MTAPIQHKIIKPEVAKAFAQYPPAVRCKLFALRQFIFDTAAEIDKLGTLEETLKWGEPSYLCKTGSTIRMDWKEATPKQYYLYFHCQTRLIETFKTLYPTEFCFQGNRAIVFQQSGKLPIEPLKHCISLALDYHRVKHLPMLGA